VIPLAIELTAILLLAVGYLAGRIRPYVRLAEWTNWQLRFHTDQWATKPRMACLLALLLLTDPVNTVRVWLRRKDAPEPKAAPLEFRGRGDA
jgi:hypothetical protein